MDVHHHSSGDHYRRCLVTIETLPFGHTAEGFTAIFTRRLDKVQADTAAAAPPDVADMAPASLLTFQLVEHAPILVPYAQKLVVHWLSHLCSYLTDTL